MVLYVVQLFLTGTHTVVDFKTEHISMFNLIHRFVNKASFIPTADAFKEVFKLKIFFG